MVTSFGSINYRDKVVVVRRTWSNTQRMFSVYLRDGAEMVSRTRREELQATGKLEKAGVLVRETVLF